MLSTEGSKIYDQIKIKYTFVSGNNVKSSMTKYISIEENKPNHKTYITLKTFN